MKRVIVMPVEMLQYLSPEEVVDRAIRGLPYQIAVVATPAQAKLDQN